MTTAADSATENAFEAVLAGRPVPPGTPGLGAVTAFTEAVRATAIQPGRPNAALAELLANGLIVDQPSPSPRTAKRRRRRMWFFSAIIAKIAGASAVAQAATGAGIVLVGFTGAGMAGVLPNPVQHTFATVVSSVTPLTPAGAQPATDTAASSSTDTATSSSSSATASSGATAATATTSSATDAPTGFDCVLTESFGACISAHAKDGTLTPGQVSAWARYYQAHRMDKAEQSDAQESADASESDSPDSPDVSAAPQRTSSESQSRHGHDSQGDHGGNGGDHGGNGGGDN